MGCLAPVLAPAALARVERVLSAYWSLAEGQRIPAQVRSQIMVQERSYSTVASAPAWAQRPATFVKLFAEQAPFEREVAGLRRASQVAANSVAAPQVLQVMPAESAVLLERVQGKAAGPELRLSLVDPSMHIGRIWQHLGAWLRAFHAAQPVDGGSDTFLDWQAALIETFLAGVADLLGSQLTAQVRTLLRLLVSRVDGENLQLTMCHGDFGLHNLLLARDRVWVTDFASGRPEPREFDLERLWSSLEDAIGFFPAAGVLGDRIRREFIAGYGQQQVRERPVSDLIRLGMRLKKLYYVRRKVSDSGAKHLWRRYMVAQMHTRLRRWTDAALRGYQDWPSPTDTGGARRRRLQPGLGAVGR